MAKLRGKKKLMIHALRANLWDISKSCKIVGISRQTHYDWLNFDEVYNLEFQIVQDEMMDFVEAKLIGLIKKENPSAIMFFLKTKGKKRGYTEKQEVEVLNQVSNWTDEEEEEMMRITANLPRDVTEKLMRFFGSRI